MLGDACAEYCKTGPKTDAEEIICHCGHAKCADEMDEEVGEGASAT